MSMILGWSGRRKILYYAVAGFVFVLLGWGVYQAFFSAAPTCFDGNQNGDERGVDCGGSSCSLICTSDTHDPVVVWARSFLTSASAASVGSAEPHTYTATAYIHNSMLTGNAKGIKYSFQLFDDKNSLIVERDGVINMPPVQNIPIVETNINAGTRTVARTLFAFAQAPVWYRPSAPIVALRVINPQLAADGSTLGATIVNDTIADAKHVTVAAVLYDAGGVARAASKSTIDVAKKSSQSVTFTWPQVTPGIVRSEIDILPPLP